MIQFLPGFCVHFFLFIVFFSSVGYVFGQCEPLQDVKLQVCNDPNYNDCFRHSFAFYFEDLSQNNGEDFNVNKIDIEIPIFGDGFYDEKTTRDYLQTQSPIQWSYVFFPNPQTLQLGLICSSHPFPDHSIDYGDCSDLNPIIRTYVIPASEGVTLGINNPTCIAEIALGNASCSEECPIQTGTQAILRHSLPVILKLS